MNFRALRISAAIAGVLVVVLILGGVWWLDDQADQDRAEDRRQANERIDRERQERLEDRADMEALERQVEALGGEPVVDQPDPVPGVRFVPVPGKEGKRGKTGRPGRDGNDGAPGADSTVPGPPGRGIEDTTCNEDGKLVIHYTDGTSKVLDGSDCDVDDDPPEDDDG
jgi:hypothetical protein